MSSMIALPAPRLAIGSRTEAADPTARSNLGHTLAISEALVGQIYLVTIVSLLVANLGRSAKPAAEGQETR
jgi:hypothetical protein